MSLLNALSNYFITPPFLTVSASAQLLEQTARLQNLSDALDKLKVPLQKIVSITQSLCCLVI